MTLHGDVASHTLCCHGFLNTEVGESVFPEHAACVQVGGQEPTFACQGLGMGERNIQNETEAMHAVGRGSSEKHHRTETSVAEERESIAKHCRRFHCQATHNVGSCTTIREQEWRNGVCVYQFGGETFHVSGL